ncbi:MAG: methylenetetrahydrofolate--tRNA-(uracil(54)-C(5))-methyltransferase (FADH(2)-oxidizing) TrmFO [Oscillospiraceae bacterium]|nr:methylenetetrahydrofolate--tRNA-(uracil(54)-C(5))-methyltransferase (FADH(2)-oxidizing) TrmFO [Oscillospiraceae bacterium]
MPKVSVIGAGLAGAEAAWVLAENGFEVLLYEMKPKTFSPAHKNQNFAELVCSNSFKSNDKSTASGLLKAEMRLLNSLIIKTAEKTAVAAGNALAVDREKFSLEITRRILEHPRIKVINDEVIEFPEKNAIICTGPLTSDLFAVEISKKCKSLYFYDAAAPIVTLESVDLNKAFFGNRYGKPSASVCNSDLTSAVCDDKNKGDYLNCPFTEEEYNLFYNELIKAETAPLHQVDKINVYEGCMPVEILAKRGRDSVRYGCMKPVGFTDPRTDKRPYALVQLRAENAEKTLFNIVGFQTNLKFKEQERVFRLIPGLENADFMRYGVMHRNTFLDSPRLLDRHFMLNNSDNVYFAGQITGTEGYAESAAGGIIAGLSLARKLIGKEPLELPETTIIGALSRYISDQNVTNFQPMGANMGLLPPLPERIKGKKERYAALAERAIKDLKTAVSD